MVKLYDGGAYLVNGAEIVPESESEKAAAVYTCLGSRVYLCRT